MTADRDAEIIAQVRAIYAEAAEWYAAGQVEQAQARQAEGTALWAQTTRLQQAINRATERREGRG